MTAPEKFYCYALLDSRKPGKYIYTVDGKRALFEYEPFYIGKGCGSRSHKHLRFSEISKQVHPKNAKIKKILESGQEIIVRRTKRLMTEVAALHIEVGLIKTIGRKDLHQGPLTNLSDGGEHGPTGAIRSDEFKKHLSKIKTGLKHSDETKEKIANSMRGRKRPDVGIKISEALRGKPKSPEHAAKIAARNRLGAGHKLSEETRQKMRESRMRYLKNRGT